MASKSGSPTVRRGWIGTSGFSYPDWVGTVYPRGKSSSQLALLAQWVDLVEINTSYYRIPEPGMARKWLQALSSRARFRWTAKLWGGFTHERTATAEDMAAQRAFLEALNQDGRLLGVLAQFPPWFRWSAAAERYVLNLARMLEGFPLAVEFRDVSWDRDEVRAGLTEHGVAWVVADLLPGPRALPARVLRTAPLAYVRFHGRNPAWYERGVDRDRRYDHLYALEDLAGWLAPIRQLIDEEERVVVTFNNHPRGQSLANALQLKSLLEERLVRAPPELVASYPQLEGLVESEGLYPHP